MSTPGRSRRSDPPGCELRVPELRVPELRVFCTFADQESPATSGVSEHRHAAASSQLLIRERRRSSGACATRASRVLGARDRHTGSSRVGPVALATRAPVALATRAPVHPCTRAPVPAHFPPFVRREWREMHAPTEREGVLLASHERAGENARKQGSPCDQKHRNGRPRSLAALPAVARLTCAATNRTATSTLT